MSAMDALTRLGDTVLERWGRLDFEAAAFPELAVEVLAAADLDGVDLASHLDWCLC